MKEKNNIKTPWVLAGYEIFSKEGPQGLKVEVISRKVNKSKSSFYHHFADIEVFTEILLQHHLERAKYIVKKESLCQNIVPELLLVLLDFKQDLFFSRQLRIHRNIPAFQECFERVNKEIGEAFLKIWAKELQLENQKQASLSVLEMVFDNFYLQITEETLNYEWLLGYINQIRSMVLKIKN